MIKKINLKKIPFHDKKVLLILLSIVVISLTAANNWFFYKYKETQTFRNHNTLLTTAQSFLNECLNLASVDDCNTILLESIKKSHWHGDITVKDADGRILVQYSTQKYQRDRDFVETNRVIGSDGNHLELTIHTFTTPSLWLSTLRSLSFSIIDIVNLSITAPDELPSFIWKVALPRSAPALSFMVIITLVFWFVRTGNRQLIERIEELDDEISRRMKEEHRLRTQLEKKEDDNLALKQQINQHKEQEGQLRDKLGKLENTLKNSTYKEERKKLNAEIKMLKEEINKIKVENINLENKLHQSELETSLLQKELSNIEQGNNSLVQEKRNLDANIEKTMSIKRRILKVLLKNPDIKKKALKRINPNKHHSKKFVQQLGDRIKENAHVSGLVQTVDSCRYNPKKRGHVVVTRNNDKHAYALQVFAKGDEGFGAEILLYAENQWQAVIEAKCIVEAISMLDGYTVEVRAS